MIDEQVQFAISQYVDGTLPPDEVPAIEARLKSDPQARQILDEYRQINAIVSSLPAPEMDWDQFSKQISAAVDEQIDRANAPIPITTWWEPVALAASVLLALTAVLAVWLAQRPSPATPDQYARQAPAAAPVLEIDISAPRPANGIVEMAVLDRQRPQGAPISEIAITQAQLPWFPQVLESYRDVTAEPISRVLIAGTPTLHDTTADDEFSGIY